MNTREKAEALLVAINNTVDTAALSQVDQSSLDDAAYTLSEGLFLNPITSHDVIRCWKLVEYLKVVDKLPSEYSL